MTTNTALVEIANVNIQEVFEDVTKIQPLLDHVHKEANSFEPDTSTKAGRDQIASMAHKVAKSKTLLDGAGKDLVSEQKALIKKVDAVRKHVRDDLDNLKKIVRKPLTDWEEAEQKRVEEIKSNIEEIRSWGRVTLEDPAARIEERIVRVKTVEIDDQYAEFFAEAKKVRDTVIDDLESMLVKRREYDAEQEELAKLRELKAKIEQQEKDAAAQKEREEAEAKREAEEARRKEEAEELAAIEEARRVESEGKPMTNTAIQMNRVAEVYPIPTGYLFTGSYSKGMLETLSIGDYGKAINVKADFLGYDKELTEGVPNAYCMPLSEKWVITVSTQYGCPMRCTFCDVPNIPMKGNATFEDMQAQFYNAISLFPGVTYTERLNLHYARMGDPIFNEQVFEFSEWLYRNKRQILKDTGLRIEVIHPVLTTSLPRKFKNLESRILQWCDIKNNLYNGQAGLQFSINSTDEAQRSDMYQDLQTHLEDFARVADKMPEPVSRKYCLNFAYSTDFLIDAGTIKRLFDPAKFMCKITPIHNNNACRENQIETIGGYDSYTPYKKPEQDLIRAGFDVLVFVPSLDEEDGLVTCGNAVLGGSTLKSNTEVIKIDGLPQAKDSDLFN